DAAQVLLISFPQSRHTHLSFSRTKPIALAPAHVTKLPSGRRRGAAHLDVQLDPHRDGGLNQVENSLKRELLQVVTGRTAADDDQIVTHPSLQPLEPPPGPLPDPALDGPLECLFNFRRPWLALLIRGHGELHRSPFG